jgi:hypothetical protein
LRRAEAPVQIFGHKSAAAAGGAKWLRDMNLASDQSRKSWRTAWTL